MRNTEMWLTGLGGGERIEQRSTETTRPGRGRLLLSTQASGVSYAEVQMLRGSYPFAPKFPFVPGYDVVGTVVEVGAGVDAALLGTRVAALTRTGAWRDYVEVGAAEVVPVPDGLGGPEAIALIASGVTAYQMLYRVAKVHSGSTVLVHGASGGVGSLLTALAVRRGVRVLGTASAAKHDELAAAGAVPLDYRGEVATEVAGHAPGGVDAVFDHLGIASLATSWRLLAPGGTLVSYGSMATVGQSQLRSYLLPLTGRLIGWNLAGLRSGRRLRPYYVAPNAALRADLAELFRLTAAGELAPQVSEQFKLTDAALAVARLAEGGVGGKLVLIP